MSERLFLSAPVDVGPRRLDPERGHYLCRVLRRRVGDIVLVIDGLGAEYEARVVSARTKACEIEVLGCRRREPAPAPRIHLLCAMVKSGPMDWLMQKATELGATDFWPLTSDYTQAHKNEPTAARVAHWQRILQSAAEQCGALHLPRLHARTALHQHFDGPPATPLVLDVGRAPLPSAWPLADTALLVGPEGGWSESEREAFDRRGWARHSVGASTLRAETAPIAAVAILRHLWDTRRADRETGAATPG